MHRAHKRPTQSADRSTAKRGGVGQNVLRKLGEQQINFRGARCKNKYIWKRRRHVGLDFYDLLIEEALKIPAWAKKKRKVAKSPVLK
jgi:hypothetical protein